MSAVREAAPRLRIERLLRPSLIRAQLLLARIFRPICMQATPPASPGSRRSTINFPFVLDSERFTLKTRASQAGSAAQGVLTGFGPFFRLP